MSTPDNTEAQLKPTASRSSKTGQETSKSQWDKIPSVKPEDGMIARFDGGNENTLTFNKDKSN